MAEPDPWREVAPGVHLLERQPFRLNVGLVVGAERALLIDTGTCLREGRELVELARRVTTATLGAVNTHSHFDHCFGNGALAPEVIWGHRLCAERLRWDGQERRREAAAQLRGAHRALSQEIAESPVVAPGCLLGDEVDLDLGERLVTLIYPGRGHTDGDVVAWLPQERVLFAGDLVEEGAPPSFEDSFPLEWPDSLANLLALDPSLVVPGHGALVDADFVRRQHADLLQLAAVSRQGFRLAERASVIAPRTAFPPDAAVTAIRRVYAQLAAISSGAWAERQPG